MNMNGWLGRTRQLQIDCFGGDPSKLPEAQRVDFIRRMVLGMVAESMEALDEVAGWKWWGAPGDMDRQAYITELVDVAHFLGALAVAVGCTDAEWAEAYAAKTAIVRERNAQ